MKVHAVVIGIVYTALGLCAGRGVAEVIFVVDAPNDFNSTARGTRSSSPYNGQTVSQTFDLSTEGDSAESLTGTLTVSYTGWFEEQNLAPVGVLGAPPVTGTRPSRQHTVFHGDYAGDMSGSGVATWTARGYPPGTDVDVYLHHMHQANYGTAVPYSITGGASGTVNMQTAPTADLVLNDTVKSHDFEHLGSGVADSSGQVQVVLTAAGWASTDAVAFRSLAAATGTLLLIK